MTQNEIIMEDLSRCGDEKKSRRYPTQTRVLEIMNIVKSKGYLSGDTSI